MEHTVNPEKVRGVTLIELMITIAVLAILIGIAYPAYTDYVERSRRSDAQATLAGFATAMERYFTTNATYRGASDGDMTNDDANGAPVAAVFPSQSPLDGSDKFYNLTVSSTATAYTLTATPIGAQVGDGVLTLTSTGARGWDRNGDGDTSDAGENCWEKSC